MELSQTNEMSILEFMEHNGSPYKVWKGSSRYYSRSLPPGSSYDHEWATTFVYDKVISKYILKLVVSEEKSELGTLFILAKGKDIIKVED